MKRQWLIAFFLFTTLFALTTCTKKSAYPDVYRYPEAVGNIIIKKCATSGCHTTQSKSGAANLDLSTWDHLFEGSSNGQPVIPYRSDFSSFLYFVNTYPEFGIIQKPTMPINKPPLTKEEVQTLKTWIDQGAPNCEGFVKFSDNPNRSKVYVTNQGCDVVTVFDAESMLPMRYITVGIIPNSIEGPHMIKVSPDGNYWYVIFNGGQYFQKYRTSDDQFVNQVSLGLYNWNTFEITSDSKLAFCTDWSSNGQIAVVDLANMTVIKIYSSPGSIKSPHGTTIAPGDSVIYCCAVNGNYLYKFETGNGNSISSPGFDNISFEPSVPWGPSTQFTPHEVAFSPEGDKYFITCQTSNEVRVMDAATDTYLTTIPTGHYPSEMSFSKKYGYLFVTCTEDTTTFPGNRGSIAVIDYKNNTFLKNINVGYQPHGITVDETKNIVYVANRNASSSGPAPHHTSVCTGRNGNVTTIDMNTLSLVKGKKIEVASDPYSAAIRK